VDGPGYGRELENSFVIAGQQALGDTARTAAPRDFLGRFERAHTWADSHPDQWAQVFATLTHVTPDVALTVATRDRFTAHPLDADVIGGEQKVADAFYAAGLIPHRVTITDFIDPRFNNS
jgi:sulfonate transport system substrate-binding protein